jgi:hypothetical protein
MSLVTSCWLHYRELGWLIELPTTLSVAEMFTSIQSRRESVITGGWCCNVPRTRSAERWSCVHLSWYVNCQDITDWSAEYLMLVHEMPLYDVKVCLLYPVSATRNIGLTFCDHKFTRTWCTYCDTVTLSCSPHHTSLGRFRVTAGGPAIAGTSLSVC